MIDIASIGGVRRLRGDKECSEMFDEVPVLPVVVPLGAMVVIGSLWHLHRCDRLTVLRAAVGVALGVYAVGIVANTVFPIFLDKPAARAPWTQSVNLTPLTGYEVADAVMNVCVFVPLGVLMALIVPRWPWWRALAAAAVLSLSIEVSQYATAHAFAGGHIADVNDLTCNVVGAAVGLLLLAALSQSPTASRVIDRFRWAEVAPTDAGAPVSGGPPGPPPGRGLPMRA